MSALERARAAARGLEEKIRARTQGQGVGGSQAPTASASGSHRMPPADEDPPPYAPAPPPIPSAAVHGVSANGSSSRSSSPFDPDLPPAHDRGTEPVTYRQYLNDTDKHWRAKTTLRIITVLANLGAIGCIIGVMANPVKWANNRKWYDVKDYFADMDLLPYCIIPFGMSAIWAAVAVFVHFVRRPPTPIHPGVALLLEIVMTIAALVGVIQAGKAATIRGEFDIYYVDDAYGYGYAGEYIQAANGTWIYYLATVYSYYTETDDYKRAIATPVPASTLSTVATVGTTPTPSVDWSTLVTSTIVAAASSATALAAKRTPVPAVDSSSSSSSLGSLSISSDTALTTSSSTSTTTTRTRTALPTSIVSRDCRPYFNPCADQDAFINKMMQHNPQRTGLGQATPVLGAVAFVLHIVMLIWSSLDLARGKEARRARRAAQKEIAMRTIRAGQDGAHYRRVDRR